MSFDPKLWKTCTSLQFCNRNDSTIAYMSEALQKAILSYGNNLGRSIEHSNLVFPREWKILTEETENTDMLFSFLFKSLKEYLDYISSFIAFPVSYVDITEIEGRKFPNPQIIPDDVDPLKYYTRMSRALLHIFSYPGLTICRCEVDAERSTSLVLSSFFDWFATLQPGASVSEVIDSMRVFKRNSNPEWTRHGLVPIVFFSQRQQPTSERTKALKSYHANDGLVPDTLLPFIAAVEQTLRVLLTYVITAWKKKQSNDRFVIPDWLFIHGIMYDALGITVYTFAPEIIECDSNNVPSKWEFVCILQHYHEFNLFRTREAFRRAGSAILLLTIQRHTERICRVLHSLDHLDLAVSPAPVTPESGKRVESHDTVKCTNTAETNNNTIAQTLEANETATKWLLECIYRAGLDLSCHQNLELNNWVFLDDPSHIELDTVLAPKNFITDFLSNWQTRNSKQLFLPEDWLTTVLDLNAHKYVIDTWKLFRILPRSQLRSWTWRCKERFAFLTTEELNRRHTDPHSFAPDFYLSRPARIERSPDFDGTPPLKSLRLNTIHSLEHFKDVYQYIAYESDAKMAVSSPLMCTPGCWLKYDTQSRFPPALATDSTHVDFSLLLHPIQTVPIHMMPLTPDVNLRATILNPALIVAIQGATAWPGEFACSPALSKSRPRNKSEALRQLAKAIEPSLKTHLINWQLRFEQGLVPTRDLPPWFMLFGLIYDAAEVTIVAHIPHVTNTSRYSFISCIVDVISFPPVDGLSKVTDPWFLDRFRVGLALLSLQKHAFRLASLWECVIWPDELISWEEIVEREYLGPVLTPLERGYMVQLNPMEQLYRDMHGSDETIVDCSGEVSDYNDSEDEMSTSGDVDTSDL